MSTMTLVDAVRQFPDIIRRVMAGRETLVITEGNRPLVSISPAAPLPTAADLAAAWPRMPHLDADDAADFEADLNTARQALPAPATAWD